MKFILIALVLISQSAFAHFKIGTYKGMDSTSTPCTIEFIGVHFPNNIKNPLNEKVQVVVNGAKSYFATHLPIVDPIQATIRPDKENLVAILPGVQKVEALRIHMDHNVGGPSFFSVFNDDWVKNHGKAYFCVNLEFEE